ncbi:phosphate transporter [Rhizoclosmatium globosum]|uniref:Phosphate transporter n=1 Tax=Rhizoclosmatium globosum TaxID=329046 RepID=A0A1Y2BMK8_9FUNG|nr:phosphate transporter [Rhizoclosmatium globosum]|eukprot:ORY35973.1 phosphate transporter [Rhizoclosmatium globosum]
MAVIPLPVHSYTGIFVVTLFFAFLDGYSIGANDVANSFATSVGSPVIIALFTEFGGAVLLGASNASTIKDNIVKSDLLMTGFMCALVASSVWVMGCIRVGMHPSTTHSIVCALVGVGTVNWSWNGRGVAYIVVGWFLAPALAAVLAGVIYGVTRWIVFSKAEVSLQRGIYAIPVYFTITGFVVSFFVIMKNGRGDWGISVAGNNPGGAVTLTGDLSKAFTIIGAMTGVIFLFCMLFAVPFFQRRLIKEETLQWYHIFYIWFVPTQPRDENLAFTLNQAMTPHIKLDGIQTKICIENEKIIPATRADTLVAPEKGHPAWIKFKKVALKGFYEDISKDQFESAKHLHANVHLFDNKTEYLFSFLQVMTASFASFSHGSNDVANSVGPFAGVFSIWDTGKLGTEAKAPVPTWMLAFALTVITAAFLALPVSTSQCIVGATLGVGFVGGNAKAINWKMFGWIALSWALTLPVASCTAGLLFYILTNTPSFTTAPVSPN